MPNIPRKYYKKNFNCFRLFHTFKKLSPKSHEINLRYKLKNGMQKSVWYTKNLKKNQEEAILETVTQELYRLVHPPQPKTRSATSISVDKNEYYVLSKEIPEFKPFFLSTENSNKILDNSITGLAATQVLALWLNEIDFKSGNVGIDKNGCIIKIDGGLGLVKLNPKFKHLHEGKNLNITRADLEALPNLQTYEACNWLRYIEWDLQKGAMKKGPTSLDKKINRSPCFKSELYRTILRITSLPDELIQFFTENYIDNAKDAAILSKFIIARKDQLKKAAEQIPAFNEYRKSDLARKQMLVFFEYLKTFKTMGKSILLSEFEDKFKINIEISPLGYAIKEHIPIKSFALKLDDYIQLLTFLPASNTKDFSKDVLFFSQLEKLKIDIESIKEIINKYFISPKISTKEMLYEALKRIKKDFEKENLLENSITSDFISLINNVLSANHNLKQEKKSITELPIKNITQPLPSISNFFCKPSKNINPLPSIWHGFQNS